MKRRGFLKGCVLATAIVAAPMRFSSIAPKISNTRGYFDPDGGFVTGPELNTLDVWANMYGIARIPGERDSALKVRLQTKFHDFNDKLTFRGYSYR